MEEKSKCINGSTITYYSLLNVNFMGKKKKINR